MKVCVVLLSVCCLCWRTSAQAISYLITAPRSLHLDAEDTVLLQFFGTSEEVRCTVYLKTSMAPDGVTLAQTHVNLNSANNHQATAKLRLFVDKVDKKATEVILHVLTNGAIRVNEHLAIPISRDNGFLFIQTDKPLYTPHQSVEVRVFSLNQELKPASRNVFLTFRDPEKQKVDILEMVDANNGIPSLRDPFKIPPKPKLGIWTIEAAYSNDFSTEAKAEFEVKEYVLPSIAITVEPKANYISYGTFNNFNFKVSARYLYGAPVAKGIVFLRFGYVGKKSDPVIVPNVVIRERLSRQGEVNVNINMEKILSKHDGPRDLGGLIDKHLYITVLVQEETGGIKQEAEYAAVKFVKSPYRLSLVSTPPFIRPNLPYNIQVLVKDHLDEPVKSLQVRLVEQQVTLRTGASERLPCTSSTTSNEDGIAFFICNVPPDGETASLRFETVNSALPASSQASLPLNPVAYQSPNRRYLYIDPPPPGEGLQAGLYAQIQVYSSTPTYISVNTLSFLVLSRGKVVHFDTQKFQGDPNRKQILTFQVTPDMVPSVRVLVYYIVYGAGTAELVADSVWLDVKAKCVNGLETELSYAKKDYKPQDKLQLDIRTNQNGVVALSAVDTALYTLRPSYRDPVNRVLRHIEKSDQGCGGGGGKDSADVFRLAGLTFFTNANTHRSSSNEPCTAIVRPKRALSEEAKAQKAQSYGHAKICCELGMRYIPKSVTCTQFALQRFKKRPDCQTAFKECCEYIQSHIRPEEHLILGRNEMGAVFDLAPSLVRSFFPESWLWEVHEARSGEQSITKGLPDSLTTWDVKAIGMFQTGICVAEPVQVSVTLPLSLDVPLPYQVVKGEQLYLTGSVYNRLGIDVQYCVTLTVGPEMCLLRSGPVAGQPGHHSTACDYTVLPPERVGKLNFTVMGLEPGEHTLTFTLKTNNRNVDTVKKKLRVVPEGILRKVHYGGRLDPMGVYGSEKRTVELKNRPPPNIVPNTAVDRMVTITGEVVGDFLSVVVNPDGLWQHMNLPGGSLEAELGRVLPLIHVYLYLEKNRKWDLMGADYPMKAKLVKLRIREGLVSLSSFRHTDGSYSMWRKRESSTWLTAAAVQTLATAEPIVPVDHQSLSASVAWLHEKTQQSDGSFTDKSSYRHNKFMDDQTDALEKSVYLTSFVLMALHKATSIKEDILQLRVYYDSKKSAADYVSRHALNLKSVYVRAAATYALTLGDPQGITVDTLIRSLEDLALQKGNPAELRYWQESNVKTDWLKPDSASGLTVETTAYALLTVILKGRSSYAKPILTWLTQDQHYGGGFFSVQDKVLTMEALTMYNKLVRHAELDQEIVVRYSSRGRLGDVHLTNRRPVATPIKLTKNDNVIVATGYGRGVSDVKMKMVFYQTTPPTKNCNFDLTVEIVGAAASSTPSMQAPHLVACAKFKPPPNEVIIASRMTVMRIQLPTGVEGYLEDLREFRDISEPTISHYELDGNTVVIQLDTVPSDHFLCVGFRVRTAYTVVGALKSLYQVFEFDDPESVCSKELSYQEQTLQRFCEGDQCQCMAAACAAYRGRIDLTLTKEKRDEETCRSHIKYALRVAVKEVKAEGDFVTFTGTVREVIKNTDEALMAVKPNTEVRLIKKVTCNMVDIQTDQQYLVMGHNGAEVTDGDSYKYRFPLDSEALVEPWPTKCSSQECQAHIDQLGDYALFLQLDGCPPPKN